MASNGSAGYYLPLETISAGRHGPAAPAQGQYLGISQQDTHYHGAASIPSTPPRAPNFSSSTQQLIGQENDQHHTPRAPTIPTNVPLGRRLTEFWKIWWLELVSCFFALASLFAIVGTAFPHQGLPLPRWPFDLSINTLVSVYMVVMKSAILLVVADGLGQMKWSWFRRARPLSHLEIFDEASRGPWGSLQLLWSIKLRRLGPTIAAVVTVLSSIMDPFGQQIVRFYPCNILDTDAIPALWTARSPVIFKTVPASPQNNVPPLHPVMTSAIQLGIFRSDATDIRVDAVCPTGDCDFPDVYHSIGFQSQCADISDEVEIHVNGTYFGHASDHKNETKKWRERIWETDDGGKGTTWLRLVNFTIPESGLYNEIAVPVFTIGCPLVKNLAEPITIYSLMVYEAPNSSECPSSEKGTLSGWKCQGFGATRCQIRPAIYSYRGAVKNGQFSENVTTITPVPFDQKSWRNRYGDYNPGITWSVIDTGCLNPSEKESLKSDNYTFPDNSTTNWMAYDLTSPAGMAYLNGSTYYNYTGSFSPLFRQGDYNSSRDPTAGWFDDKGNLRPDIDNSTLWRRPNVTDIRPQCIYQIQDIDYRGLALELSEIITGRLMFSMDLGAGLGNNVMIPQAFYQGTGNISVASMQAITDNMLKTMSTSLRNTKTTPDGSFLPLANYPVLGGKAYKNDTCVRIEWIWLVFPAALNLMTVILMFMLLRTHALSKRHQGDPLTQHDYKTAVVPLLLHGFDWQKGSHYHEGAAGGGETVAETEKRMRGTKRRWYARKGADVLVRFEGRGKDWRLVEVEGDALNISPEIRKG
ncbi:Protein of unknown function (DUF3176) domain containing protein [Rhypophila decipiens]